MNMSDLTVESTRGPNESVCRLMGKKEEREREVRGSRDVEGVVRMTRVGVCNQMLLGNSCRTGHGDAK